MTYENNLGGFSPDVNITFAIAKSAVENNLGGFSPDVNITFAIAKYSFISAEEV